jgi:hypothetical protein
MVCSKRENAGERNVFLPIKTFAIKEPRGGVRKQISPMYKPTWIRSTRCIFVSAKISQDRVSNK